MIALIRNHGQAEVKIEKNERLLQMVLMKKLDVEVVEVEELSAVGVERTGGFGSTGTICHHKVLDLTSNLEGANPSSKIPLKPPKSTIKPQSLPHSIKDRLLDKFHLKVN